MYALEDVERSHHTCLTQFLFQVPTRCQSGYYSLHRSSKFPGDVNGVRRVFLLCFDKKTPNERAVDISIIFGADILGKRDF